MRPRPAGALGWTESRSRVSSAGAGHDDEGAHMAKYPHDSQTALFNMSAVMYGGGEETQKEGRGCRSGSERMCKRNRWSGNKCIVITSFKQRSALWGPWLPFALALALV